MSHHTPIQLLSDDDEDDNNNNNNNSSSYNSPVSKHINNNNKRHRPNTKLTNFNNNNNDLLIIDDDPTPPPPSKLLKSSSTPLIIPETPFSDLPFPRPRPFPVDLELITVESQGEAEKDFVKACSSSLGTRSTIDCGKDLKPVYSMEEKKLNDEDLEKWLDIDSVCYLHASSPSKGQSKNGDMMKINSSSSDQGSCVDYVKLDSENCYDFGAKNSPENLTRKLDSENCYDFGAKNSPEKRGVGADIDVVCLEESPIIVQSTSEYGHFQSFKTHDYSYLQDGTDQVQQLLNFDKENSGLESDSIATGKELNKERATNKNKAKEEKMRLMEEKKLKKEQEKLQKAALKAEAAKLKELEKEKKKLDKFKFNEKNILAKIDKKVIQMGKIGGHLVTKFGEKDLKFDPTSNLINKSIIWTMTGPEGMSQLSSLTTQVPYILLIYEAEEFCKIVNDGSLFSHISSVQTHYPDYKICCLTNRLMSYINRRENDKYKNRKDSSDWNRPPVEEVLAKLTTQFANVHSRQCVDEAEVAEHVVGLTYSLAKCHSRKKLTHLSVNANGSNVPKDCPDRSLIMKHPWLKALVSIPKVQPRFAIAIWKKYPSMKSLLRIYLDPTKSVHEKEFLLQDLQLEGLFGNEDRRLGEICSKRVYRVLMAQNGSFNTDDVETGADFFHAANMTAPS